mmetsp:Transcript_5603/g.17399  ORF Transcript_5603/g.17399 Transcript_5603/m.17399 type:complete len:229 (-) Transcript_5603:28-714(-)
MTPRSPGCACASRNTVRAALRSHAGPGFDGPTRCSRRSRSTNASSCDFAKAASHVAQLAKTPRTASDSASGVSAQRWSASCASADTQAASSGVRCKSSASSDRRRKPTSASNGVSASMSLGRWFASGYVVGSRAWSARASSRSGCAPATVDRCTEWTQSAQGRSPSNCRSSVPSSSVAVAVSSRNSAYAVDGSQPSAGSAPFATARRAARESTPRMPHGASTTWPTTR